MSSFTDTLPSSLQSPTQAAEDVTEGTALGVVVGVEEDVSRAVEVAGGVEVPIAMTEKMGLGDGVEDAEG
jgi:hypothetical protein